MNWWNKHFLHAGTNSGKLKVDSMIFGWTWSKMATAFFSSWDPKIYCILRMILWIELIFLNANSDVIIFVRLISYSLIFKCWFSTAVVLLVFLSVNLEPLTRRQPHSPDVNHSAISNLTLKWLGAWLFHNFPDQNYFKIKFRFK